MSGSSLLILTVTDSSAESYYGEQGLYYADVKGETCLVPRGRIRGVSLRLCLRGVTSSLT